MAETTEPVNDEGKKQTEIQRNAELVANWYQSYYLWSSTVMASSVMNARVTNHGARVLNMPLNNTNATLNESNNLNENSNNNNNNHRRRLGRNNNQNQSQILQPAAIIYKVPSLSKRFAAECFDAIYIQCLKVSLALFFINYTDLISEDSFNIYDFLEDLINEDNIGQIRLPVELLLLEIAYVLISVIFESYCLYKKGYTPGKYFLNMKIISCTEITELMTPNHIRVSPGAHLSLKSILIRTCLKNFSIIFLFPTIVFFLLPAFVENGQTTYDKIAESIVVENSN